jgi:Ca2+-binding EF-hand superfamily protein
MKSKNLKSGIIALLLCLGCMTFSSAQQKGSDRKEPPTYAQLLKEMDRNEDGKLAKSELKGPLKDDFSKIDTDKDGFITKKEFKKAPKPKGKGQRS